MLKLFIFGHIFDQLKQNGQIPIDIRCNAIYNSYLPSTQFRKENVSKLYLYCNYITRDRIFFSRTRISLDHALQAASLILFAIIRIFSLLNDGVCFPIDKRFPDSVSLLPQFPFCGLDTPKAAKLSLALF